MVINHLEKLFVTNDAATILRELEVRKLSTFDITAVGKCSLLSLTIDTTIAVVVCRCSTQQQRCW